jgi:hypothetical protein
MMITDLGLTFGQASILNRNKSSVSLDDWSQVPVWKDPARCVAELTGSFTGSFSSPTITEEGRAFLASLLVQLSDAQLRDLFVNARVKQRSSDPDAHAEKDAPLARVDEWVTAFKQKRAQIVDQRCP